MSCPRCCVAPSSIPSGQSNTALSLVWGNGFSTKLFPSHYLLNLPSQVYNHLKEFMIKSVSLSVFLSDFLFIHLLVQLVLLDCPFVCPCVCMFTSLIFCLIETSPDPVSSCVYMCGYFYPWSSRWNGSHSYWSNNRAFMGFHLFYICKTFLVYKYL